MLAPEAPDPAVEGPNKASNFQTVGRLSCVLLQHIVVHEQGWLTVVEGQHLRSVESHDRLARARWAGDEIVAVQVEVVDEVLLFGEVLERRHFHEIPRIPSPAASTAASSTSWKKPGTLSLP